MALSVELYNVASWSRQLASLTRAGLGALLLGMVALNVANALGRYLLGQAIEGSDELMVFGMAWLVFLGMPLVAFEGRHLCFSWLQQKLPTRYASLLSAVLNLYMAALCGWIAIQSSVFIERVTLIGQKSMAAGIPMVIPHAALLFGLVATALVCAAQGCYLVIQCLSDD